MTQPSNLYIDPATLILLKSRDRDFLSRLFIETNPYLVKVCASHKFFKDIAEELIHQTWETFFTNLDQFEGRSQLRTFLCGILFNKIREHRRKNGKFVFEEDPETYVNSAFSAEGWWKTDPVSPEVSFQNKEMTLFVNDCLEGLTEQQRSVFILKEVDDDEPDDICKELGLTISHLRVLLFRAKEKLRKCLEGKAQGNSAT